jgi:hypothetical protein
MNKMRNDSPYNVIKMVVELFKITGEVIIRLNENNLTINLEKKPRNLFEIFIKKIIILYDNKNIKKKNFINF